MCDNLKNIYKTIFDNSGVATALSDDDMKVQLINPSFHKLSGYSQEDVKGMSLTDLFSAEDFERIKEYRLLKRVEENAILKNG